VLIAAATLLVLIGVGYAVSRLGSGGSAPSALPDRPTTLPTATGHQKKKHHHQATLVSEEPVYYLGDGPSGALLFPFDVPVFSASGSLETAVDSLEEKPDLAQYRTVWKPGWLTGATRHDGVIDVDADGAPERLPAGLEARSATESIQQVVYTMQAATHSHAPVRFLRNGRPAASVLGVPTTRPLPAAPRVQALSPVEVSEPEADGIQEGRAPVRAAGEALTPGATVDVRIERGGALLRTRPATSAGTADSTGLYPWHVLLDVKGLAHGTYQVVATVADPLDPTLDASDRRPLNLAGR
jgi:hypothetical protein